MDDEIQFGKVWVRRQGNKILIDPAHLGPTDPFRIGLAITLTEDQGIALDPDWERERMEWEAHVRAWRELVERLNLSSRMEMRLDRNRPPLNVADEAAMIAYLRTMAAGDDVSSLSSLEKYHLTEALEQTFPEQKP